MNAVDFRNTPSHLDLADYGEVRSLLEHWTGRGVMKFRWPADDNAEYSRAAREWLKTADRVRVLAPVEGGDAAKEHIEMMDKLNKGVAFEAFLEYWDSIPRRRAEKIYHSCQSLYLVVMGISEILNAYKTHALQSLLALQEALDKNNDWTWSPWGRSPGEVDKSARSLIEQFDYNMEPSLRNFSTQKGLAQEIVNKHITILFQLSQVWTHDLKLEP